MDQAQRAINATQNWVNTVVIDLNFCPFAKREVQRKSIRYVTTSNTLKAVLGSFLEELHKLDSDSEIETTLLILPMGFEQFDDYLDLVDRCETILDQGGYRGIFQLASFHPDYCFEGEPDDSPSNYTNKSPFPTLHLLRESSLERATSNYARAEEIPENNIQKSESLGIETLSSLLQACMPKT